MRTRGIGIPAEGLYASAVAMKENLSLSEKGMRVEYQVGRPRLREKVVEDSSFVERSI